MTKTMCEAGKKKRVSRREEEARYTCKRCGEKVSKKKYVCKPHKLDP